jgi:rhomboid protease GluP
MAFGFTPKFEQELDLNGLDPEHYLFIAIQAAKNLNWKIANISKTGFTAFSGFSMRSWNEQVTVIVEPQNVILQSKCLGNQLWDWGKNKDNIENFISEFDRIQSSFTDEEINEKVASIIAGGDSTTADASPAAALGKNKTFLSFFVPREGYFVTPILIDLNLLVFLLMALSGVSMFEPSIESLIAWGANLRSITLAGQSWRLLTNVFLHIGIFHVLMNMYALLYIGILLEPYLGKAKFAAAYLFTGILASLTSIYWHPATVSAGASGAIFGMYGVFLALLTTNVIGSKTRSALLTSIGVFVVFNLMNGVKSGIDNAAHIGGLISGLAIGYAYYPTLKKPDVINLKYLTIGLLFFAVLATSFVIYRQIPDGTAKYMEKMKEFGQNENMALNVFNGKNSVGPEMLPMIKNQGIDNWNENLKIIDQADKLDIPQELKQRDRHIRQYCLIQLKKYRLLYKAIEQNNTLQYDRSIDSCNKSINEILKAIKGNN